MVCVALLSNQAGSRETRKRGGQNPEARNAGRGEDRRGHAAESETEDERGAQH